MTSPAAPTASFDEVLEEIQRGAETAEGYAPAGVFTSTVPPMADEPAYASSSFVSQLYERSAVAFSVSDEPLPPQVRVEPVPLPAVPRILLPSTRIESIARELRIRPTHTVPELLEMRRRFALRNHPDRADSASRDAATTRMSIANMLIDSAIQARNALQN